jgi:hypothetical protein
LLSKTLKTIELQYKRQRRYEIYEFGLDKNLGMAFKKNI